ncbi:unnamed protein product [Caenorhabditis auriculariae]|uniref:Major facilitator superfamily (MFS) profile domain-containing protein n=1 Tax=Caenorhabditis auriculariae TaxID=2777116 RepID=A0A8S1H233_9PELO|nr:unnamed protein product [Caenorhabditis auriculariae]
MRLFFFSFPFRDLALAMELNGEIKMKEQKEGGTEWRSLAISASITFFAAVQFTIFFASLWPYLLQLDHQISEEFFGYINAVYSLGQAVMCPAFGYWCNRINQSRLPILTGVVIMTLGNVLYLLSPVLSISPSWVIFYSRLTTGIGAGVLSVLRNYAVLASTPQDRSRSISLNAGCFALGLTIGPAIQIFFTPLGYPGFHLIGDFSMNMYTAPAYFGIFLNILCISLIIFFFKESSVGIMKKTVAENDEHTRFFALPKPSKAAIATCIATRFAQMFVITNIETIGAPLAMTMFNWNKKETVTYNSIMHAGFGAISFILYALNVFFNLGKNINHRIGSAMGLIGIVIFHLVTFPWWGLPGKITYQETYINVNGTTILNPDPIGCRPGYQWYNFALSGTMQGILMLSGSVARMCGPIIVSKVFTAWGPRPAWIMEILVAGGAATLWAIFYKKTVPLKLPNSLSAGSIYRNKHGLVYKF